MSSSGSTRPGRRWRLSLGVALVLAGLVVLGYVGWQYWVTNWLSERRHHEIVDRLERSWDSGHRRVRAADSDAGAIVRIPRFGDDYAVPVIEGTSEDALAAGIGHFEGTAEPGAVGNYALAAHRVTHGEPFSDMPSLRPGDEVLVETADEIYTYTLDTGGEDLEVSFDDTWVTDPHPTNPEAGGVQPLQAQSGRLITLTTCAELFHTDQRLVAFGHLTGKRPR